VTATGRPTPEVMGNISGAVVEIGLGLSARMH
jgi:hypothetical protein